MQQTSLDAYWDSRKTAAVMRATVLAYVRAQDDGATDDEMDVALNTGKSRSNRPARLELVRMGLVMDSGRRRPTRSNRSAIVWLETPADQVAVQVAKQKKAILVSALKSRIGRLTLAKLERLDAYLSDLEKEPSVPFLGVDI
jgi:hypothetical protein